MSASALVVMVLVCSLIWGGFAVLLARAFRQESGIQTHDMERHPPHPSP